ncbi:MAG: carboxylating nicotinate-nucleotide diphosphorylase [Desulfobacterales bacterium]|jgi:nicotinate-nucleotide pyrophosphorylase (carboxylating)|nr:carboxylating nicotinate-nucleotide diphosphorylase [Desulfobacterales bacterium]
MHSVDELIEIALKEDIGFGDITTDAIVSPNLEGIGDVGAKDDFILAGLDVARHVFNHLDPQVVFSSTFKDGDRVKNGRIVFSVRGKLASILKAERTALNFIQRLSGIATLTRAYVDSLEGVNVRIVDTRKTTPGWREIEKYAVKIGGGSNHRMGLYDGVLIKDNHIAAGGGIRMAVDAARKRIHHLVKIEVEVTNMVELAEALSAGADVIMLDNMTPDQIRKAVKEINSRALVEVSGGVNLENIRGLAQAGVDFISVGALTHSAKSVDMSMKIRNH